MIDLEQRPSASDFTQDLNQITLLQRQWDQVIDDGEGSIPRNFNPVLERSAFDRWEGDIEEFKVHERQQLITSLRERYRVVTSTVRYRIDSSGHAYNELFPNEPFDQILERGLAYREEHNSLELEREESEVAGFRKVIDRLHSLDTPLGSKMTVISGPGIIAGTAYEDNFVDEYTLIGRDSGGNRIIIEMTRHASDLSYGDYLKKAQIRDPNFLRNFYDPIDSGFLANPIMGTIEGFDEATGSMDERTFQQYIVQECERLGLVDAFIEDLCGGDFKPAILAQDLNSINKIGDIGLERWQNRGALSRESEAILGRLGSLRGIRAIRNLLGEMTLKEFMRGCGRSGRFKLRGSLSNSVARFALRTNESDQKGSRWFQCDKCEGWNDRPYEGTRKFCKHCGANVSCGDPSAV